MEVTREPFDDRSARDENGMYTYIYVGAYYYFREGDDEIVFSWYEDEPNVASLGNPIDWSPKVYASDMFRRAVEYLRLNEGVQIIELCDPTPPGRGFIPMDKAIKIAAAAGLPVPHTWPGHEGRA